MLKMTAAAAAILLVGCMPPMAPGLKFTHFSGGFVYHCEPEIGMSRADFVKACGNPTAHTKAKGMDECWAYDNKAHGIGIGSPADWVVACFSKKSSWDGSPLLDLMVAVSEKPPEVAAEK